MTENTSDRGTSAAPSAIMPHDDDTIPSSHPEPKGPTPTGGGRAIPRASRWTDAVVEVLEDEPEVTDPPPRARRSSRGRRPMQDLAPPTPTPELQLALSGAMTAHSLHRRAEAELSRTRHGIRIAWTVAGIMAIVAAVCAMWSGRQIVERERSYSRAETRATMLAEQLQDSRRQWSQLAAKAKDDAERLEQTRVRLATVETELGRTVASHDESSAAAREQRTLAAELTAQLAEQRRLTDKLNEERAQLTERLAQMSRQFLETQRELAKLRAELGLIEPAFEPDWADAYPADPGARSNIRTYRP